MKKTNILILTVLLAVNLFITISCNKDNSEDDPKVPDFIFETDKTSVKPYEMLTLSVSDIILTQEEYRGKFGDIDITAQKVDDENLILMTPALALGNHSVVFDFDGLIGSAEIMVEEIVLNESYQDIIEPVWTALQNKVEYLENIASQTGAVFSSHEKDLLNNLSSQFETIYSQMNENDKIQLAHFIVVNADLFSSANTNQLKSKEDLIKQYNAYLARAIINVGWAGTSLGLMLAAPDPTLLTKGIAVVAAGFLVAEMLELGGKIVEMYNTKILKSFSELMKSVKSDPDFTFRNNEEVLFNVMMEYRTLYKEDIGTSDPVLANILSNLNIFQFWWGKVDGFVSGIKTLFGFQSGGLANRPVPVSEIATYSSIAEPVDATYASITQITNPEVTVNTEKIDQQIKAKFITEKNEDQDFNFTYGITMDGYTFEKTYSAKLSIEKKEAFSISKVSGDNQVGNFGVTLQTPIVVIVKDAEGNPFEGATVHFAPNNGGSVSSSQVISDSNGMAEVLWTPGSSASTQTITVYSFQDDNTTHLQGSPLSFTATVPVKEAYIISKVSGDNQSGKPGESLQNPVVVVVKDKDGNPFGGTIVYFTPDNGGSVSQSQVTTDSQGQASVSWTLGNNDNLQTLSVSASNNTTTLQGSPLIFTAAPSCSTFYIDGYEAVQIGSQIWMAKNLNIATANSWCYDNNSLNCATYGRLYTWDAAKMACPTGWHLPSDAEWTQLKTYLGLYAGGKLKETGTTHWSTPNSFATNETCFTALPGGRGGSNGTFFMSVGTHGNWWSSTEAITNTAWVFYLLSNSGYIDMGYYHKLDAMSVRCLRD